MPQKLSILTIISNIYQEVFMSGREFVKILLAKECITLTELAKIASEKSDKKYTMDGLSHKMRLGTLRFDDAEFFAKLLGYEIELKKVEKEVD